LATAGRWYPVTPALETATPASSPPNSSPTADGRDQPGPSIAPSRAGYLGDRNDVRLVVRFDMKMKPSAEAFDRLTEETISRDPAI